MTKKNTPKVEKLETQEVPIRMLGTSTLDKPIPADRASIHRAVIARELAASRRARGSR